jgi:hypothetical protein
MEGFTGSSEHGRPARFETLVAEDFSQTINGPARGAERALLSALLFDGVQAFLSYCRAVTKDERARYREAYYWVMQTEDDYPFAFPNVCENLGIHPEYLRAGLLNVANSESATQRKKMRRAS